MLEQPTIKQLSDSEFFARLDAIKSLKTKQSIRNHAGKTADELFETAIKKSKNREPLYTYDKKLAAQLPGTKLLA